MKALYAILFSFLALQCLGQGASFHSSGCYRYKLGPNCQDSVDIFNKLLKTDAGNADYYYRRAMYLNYCNDLNAAIRSCDTAIAMDSTQACFFGRRSYFYLDAQKLNNALQDAHTAVRLDSNDAANWCVLSSAYGTFNMYDSVLPAVERALRINPKYYDAICLKGLYLKLKDRNGEAIVELSKAVKIKPKDSYAYHIRIGAYGKTGKYKEAIADIDKVLSMDSCYTELYFYKGNYYYSLNKPDSAMYWYTLSIEKHERSLYSYYYRAWLFERKGEVAKAGEDFLQAALLGYNNAVEELKVRYPAYYTRYMEQRKK